MDVLSGDWHVCVYVCVCVSIYPLMNTKIPIL